MATIQQNNEEENEQGQTPILGSGSPAPSGGASSVDNAPGTQRKGSGRFTNLQKYLQANEGSGERLAGGIQKQAESKASNIRQGIESQASGIREGIQSEQQRLQSQPGYLEQIQTQGGAQQIAGDENQLQQFQQLRQGQHSGQDLGQQAQNIYGQYQQGIGELQDITNQAGTEEGRFNLLRQAYGTPQYGMGQRRLDQLFLQADKQDPLRDLRQSLGQQASEAETGLGQFQGEIDPAISGIGQQADEYSQQLNQFLMGGAGEGLEDNLYQRGIGDIESDLESRLGQFTDQQRAASQSLQQALESGTYTPEQMQQLGLQTGQTSYGLTGADLGQYIGAQQLANLSQIASPEDIQRYQALSTLRGQDPSLQLDLEQAGQAPGLLNIDQDRLQQELGRREQAFESEFSPLAQRYGSLQEALGKTQSLVDTDPLSGLGDTATGGFTAEELRSSLDPYRGQLATPELRTQYDSLMKNLALDNAGNTVQHRLDGSQAKMFQDLFSSSRDHFGQNLRDVASTHGALSGIGKEQVTGEDRFQNLLDRYISGSNGKI